MSVQQAEQIIQQLQTAGFPAETIAQLKQQPIEYLAQVAQQYRLPDAQQSTNGPRAFTGYEAFTTNPQNIYNRALQSAQEANKAYNVPPASYVPLLPDPGRINRPTDPNSKMYVRFNDGTNGWMTYDQAAQIATTKGGQAWTIKN